MEMGYIDKPLARGGRVVFRTRLHPVIFAGTAAFAAFVLGAVALIVSRNELSPRTVALLWLAGVLVGPGSLLPLYVRWRTSEFAVTDRRGGGQGGGVPVHPPGGRLPAGEGLGVRPTARGRRVGRRAAPAPLTAA